MACRVRHLLFWLRVDAQRSRVDGLGAIEAKWEEVSIGTLASSDGLLVLQVVVLVE
jgi:hypothetical protein